MTTPARSVVLAFPPVNHTPRRCGAIALGAVAAVVVGVLGVGVSGAGPVSAGMDPPSTLEGEPDTSVPVTSEPTSTEPASTTTTTTTTTTVPLPVPGGAIQPPAGGDGLPDGARGNPDQATDTFPPPPTTTTTTTLPPDPTRLPEETGSGRRVVYSKSRQRVWLIEADESIARTYPVSGRLTWNQPTPNNPANTFEPAMRYYADPPAFYRVTSRSGSTCNIKRPYICWRYMIRFTKGPEGDNIGLHQIPINTRTGAPVQTLAQLGQALSSGCVRQSPEDAAFVWNWAWEHTKVVVVA